VNYAHECELSRPALHDQDTRSKTTQLLFIPLINVLLILQCHENSVLPLALSQQYNTELSSFTATSRLVAEEPFGYIVILGIFSSTCCETEESITVGV